MDKKSKLLLFVLVFLTGLSVGYAFFDTVVRQNFEIIESEEETI